MLIILVASAILACYSKRIASAFWSLCLATTSVPMRLSREYEAAHVVQVLWPRSTADALKKCNIPNVPIGQRLAKPSTLTWHPWCYNQGQAFEQMLAASRGIIQSDLMDCMVSTNVDIPWQWRSVWRPFSHGLFVLYAMMPRSYRDGAKQGTEGSWHPQPAAV